MIKDKIRLTKGKRKERKNSEIEDKVRLRHWKSKERKNSEIKE